MLASMIEIDNLHRVRKVQGGKSPDPFGAVAHDDLLERTAPATFPGFEINAFAKLFGGFDGARIGGGIGIPNRIALLVRRRLAEHTLEPGVTGMGELVSGMALRPHGPVI